MSAAEYQAVAAQALEDAALIAGLTEQMKLRDRVGGFDYNAPLPDLHIRHTRSWEPAARHYRDIETDGEASND